MKIAVIADDFTGANDIGVQFFKYGQRVVSMLENKSVDCDVKIIDSETRNIKPSDAYKKSYKFIKEMIASKPDKFYKKIDSTLRGNIKEELKALIDNLLENEKILFVPSFPKMGRSVIKGKHYLNGKPLNKTEFAADPVRPITTNNILEILGQGENIEIDIVRNDLKKKLMETKSRVLIIDAETEEDMEEIAKNAAETGMDKYIVGSAGLMNYLPFYWGLKKRENIFEVIKKKNIKEEPIAIISGSCSLISLEQIAELRKEKKDIDYFKIDIKNQKDDIPEITGDVILTSIGQKKEMEETITYYLKEGFTREEMNRKIIERISETVKKILDKNNIKKFILIGGETAVGVIKKESINGAEIIGIVDEGTPLCKSIDGKFYFITKPGAFGEKKIIFRAYEILKNVENICGEEIKK